MEDEKIRKRGINRSKEAIVADIDGLIMKHETQIQESEEKNTKTVAYHRACIETLKIKREATLNPEPRKTNVGALMTRMKEKGLTIEDLMKKIDEA